MKKIFSAALFAALFGFNQICDAKPTSGGFVGPENKPSVSTVEQAHKMNDDTKVTLIGNIEKSLGDEKYLFKDNTGSIVIEIDDEDWNGLTVTPEVAIEIVGEVDKDLMKDAEIDVDIVRVAQ